MSHSNRSKSTAKAGREPRPEEIAAARTTAGHTQQQAADTIYTSLRSIQNWEQAHDGRKMPASAYELYMLKTGQFVFDDLIPNPEVSGAATLRLKLDNGAKVDLSLGPQALASLSSGLAPVISSSRK